MNRPYPPFREIIELPIPADLSVASFEEAILLLKEDRPRVLGGSEEQLTQGFSDWLWKARRGVSVILVPKEILGFHWWLEGYYRTVISRSPR